MSHIEDLVTSEELRAEELEGFLVQDKNFPVIKAELFRIYKQVGTEKLKPIYVALDGRYDYIIIRLYRLLYNLTEK